MGQYLVTFDDVVKEQLAFHKKAGNQATIKRIERILNELHETPFIGIGKQEALKGDLSDYWSRHINKKDVMIYEVFEETKTVYISSALGHYNDK